MILGQTPVHYMFLEGVCVQLSLGKSKLCNGLFWGWGVGGEIFYGNKAVKLYECDDLFFLPLLLFQLWWHAI